MAGFNRVVLVGNLCRDPELKYTPSGTAIANMSLAVTTKKKDGDDTVFIDITAWERQAETCCEYLKKGSSVLVEGRLKLDQWDDKESGKKRSKISVTAQTVQFLGGKQAGEQGQERSQDENKLPIQDRDNNTVKDDDCPF